MRENTSAATAEGGRVDSQRRTVKSVTLTLLCVLAFVAIARWDFVVAVWGMFR